MMQTEPGFEKSIDDDPLNATTHLVYADWHDDQGQHDEAAFRRSMGNWIHNKPPIGSYFADAGPPEEADNPQTWPWHIEAGGWDSLNKPEGVSRFPFTHEEEYERDGGSVDTRYPRGSWGVNREPHHPVWINHVVDEIPSLIGRFAWPNYRAMEQSFRESFMRNRAQKLSRRVTAYKKHRRGA